MGIRPVIVLAGGAGARWAATLESVLDGAGFALEHHTTRQDYISGLVDAHAALVIVDGDQPEWRDWVTTLKANQATRRIPVVVVAEDGPARREALSAGADFALSPTELAGELPPLLAEHARVPDPAWSKQLDRQCREPLPPRAQEAIEQFNAGEYYRQHDLLEALWMEENSPVRDLYRAILQVGIAYYQITRGNHRGALKMLLRSVQWLAALPDVCQGVDVKQLRADSARVRAALEAMAPGDIGTFDQRLLSPVRLIEPDATR